MGTLEDKIEEKIETISRKSDKFKIGKTGESLVDRMKYYPDYQNIELVHESKDKNIIDNLEAEMISRFIGYQNNRNKIGGSAGDMGESQSYKLYVVHAMIPIQNIVTE